MNATARRKAAEIMPATCRDEYNMPTACEYALPWNLISDDADDEILRDKKRLLILWDNNAAIHVSEKYALHLIYSRIKRENEIEAENNQD